MSVEPLTALVVGGGPGGLCTAILLKQRGIHDFVVLEKSAGVGGTWFNNRYPGLACDVPSDLYSYTFYQDYDWTTSFSSRDELLAYFESAANRFELAEHIRVDAEVESARWDEAHQVWSVTDVHGREYTARVLVGAVGMFNEASAPAIPGLDRFHGPVVHTAHWPADDSSLLAGKRVAVIGSAASAIQIVPSIAPVVERVELFQRTSNWVLPKDDRVFSAEERRERLADPSQLPARRAESLRFVERSWDVTDREAMAELRVQGLENLTAVADPALREALTPHLPVGAQRTLVSSDYYPAFNRDNVALVTSPIVELFDDGIVTADGQQHAADTVVLATGYAAHKFFSIVDVVGRDGTSLREQWQDGAYAYLGMTVEKFPNMFMMYGPNSNGGSIIDKLESQARYIVGKIDHLRSNGIGALEVRAEVVEAYNTRLQELIAGIEQWQIVGSRYYRAPGGRVVTQCPYNPVQYDELTRRDDLGSFDVAPLAAGAVLVEADGGAA